jgi:hypothetical protein
MPFLTFDSDGSDQPGLEDLRNGPSTPDEIECGENNKFWVKARRKAKVMVLIDKMTGKELKKVDILQPGFARIAQSYGVGPRQIGAVKDALRLK